MPPRVAKFAFSHLAVVAAVVAAAGCERPPAKTAEAPRTITIKKTNDVPTPPKSKGGKLAVLDQRSGPPLQPVVQPRPSPRQQPVEPQPDRYRSDADFDPRYDPPGQDPSFGADMEDEGLPVLTVRDCRRAERRGDPLADSRACRTLNDDRGDPQADWRTAADCREAADVGDPYADSRACRRVLGR